jgi:hypothetical protein
MPVGRMLIVAGVVMVLARVLLTFAGRLPFRLGRLPGDIYVQGRSGSFYFPIVTCLVLSAVFSVVMWILRR